MSRYDVDGKSVIITGGASGIGLCTARLLISKGAQVTLVDLHEDSLAAAVADLPAAQVQTLAGDVTDAARMAEVVDLAVKRFGKVDVVMANAGIANDPPGTMAATPLPEFERVVEVDLNGVIRTIKPALEQIIANQGHVLVTASIYSFANGVVNAPYALSKAAVESLTRALRLELAPFGATAGSLHPGWVRTPLTGVVRGENASLTEFKQLVFKGPLGAVIEPEDVAAAAVRGIERRSAQVITPKVFVPYSAVRGLANSLLDSYLAKDRSVLDIVRRIDAEAREHYAARAAAATTGRAKR